MPRLPYAFPFIWGVQGIDSSTLITADVSAAAQTATATDAATSITLTAETATAVAQFAAWAELQAETQTSATATPERYANADAAIQAATSGIFGRILTAACELGITSTTTGSIIQGLYGETTLSLVCTGHADPVRDALADSQIIVAWDATAVPSANRNADSSSLTTQAVASSAISLETFLRAEFGIEADADALAQKRVGVFAGTVVTATGSATIRATFVAGGQLVVVAATEAATTLAVFVGGSLAVTVFVGAPVMNLPLGQLNASLQVAFSSFGGADSPFIVAIAEAVSRIAETAFDRVAAVAAISLRDAGVSFDRQAGLAAPDVRRIIIPPDSRDAIDSDRRQSDTRASSRGSTVPRSS